jgi:hypothetical protein
MTSMPSFFRRFFGERLHDMTFIAVVLAMSACSSSDVSNPVTPDPAHTYRSLTLQSHAITMSTVAPYDTLQLVATVNSGVGTPLEGAPAPTFITTDSSVRVSSTGLLTARAARSGVKVIAALVYQGVRLADTAVITVTNVATPQRATRLTVQPQTGEDATLPTPTQFSAIYGASGTKMLDVQVQDGNQTVIPEALVALQLSTPFEATFFGSSVSTSGSVEIDFDPAVSHPGVVVVSAAATIYGVTLHDTLRLTLTNPKLAIFSLQSQTVSGDTPGSTRTTYSMVPGAPVPIEVGGVVWWWNQNADSLDIVFDNPNLASADNNFLNTGSGNISPFSGCDGFLDQCQNVYARQFNAPGTVHFHSLKTGVSGTIVVQ